MLLMESCRARTSLALLALLAGCSSGRVPGLIDPEADAVFRGTAAEPFTIKVDQFTGDSTILSPPVELGYLAGPAGTVALYWHREVRRRDSGVFPQVVMYYAGRDWLFIEPGASLILLIDGVARTLEGSGSGDSREVRTGGLGVAETSAYPITLALLRELAAAKDVRVRLVGKQGNADRRFTPLAFRTAWEAIRYVFPDSTGRNPR